MNYVIPPANQIFINITRFFQSIKHHTTPQHTSISDNSLFMHQNPLSASLPYSTLDLTIHPPRLGVHQCFPQSWPPLFSILPTICKNSAEPSGVHMQISALSNSPPCLLSPHPSIHQAPSIHPTLVAGSSNGQLRGVSESLDSPIVAKFCLAFRHCWKKLTPAVEPTFIPTT